MANKREEQLKEITERLEQGVQELFTSERYREYLNTMAKFHNYSFNNTLLITMQRPDATLVAGYQAWQKKFNRHVLRGEKGIQIISPAPIREKEEVEKINPETNEPILKANGQPETEIIEHVIPRFKVATVFDVSQTEGEPLPDLGGADLTGQVADFTVFMEAIRNVSPVPIRFAEIEGTSHGYYHNTDKEIVIKSGMSESQTMKTAIHEVTHALLHDRDLMEEQGIEKDKMTKEVEAESVAYIVCQHFGLDDAQDAFGIGGLHLSLLAVRGEHLNRGTNCTPVGRQLRIAGTHLLDVLLGVSAFRQDRYNVLHGEIPFFLFLVPGSADFSIFKKLDGVIFVHGLFPPSMGYSHSTMK